MKNTTGPTTALIEKQLDEAERKAWDSLGRYKFQMFGYWAAVWVHMNGLLAVRRHNPFKDAVDLAKQRKETSHA